VAAGSGVARIADLGLLPTVLARAQRAEPAVRPRLEFFGVGLAWGVAISVVAILQLIVAVALRYPYDHWDARAMLLGPIYPMLFWVVSASAAVNQRLTALIRGPQERRVVWDIPREPLDSTTP
jgi:hypothetical protein